MIKNAETLWEKKLNDLFKKDSQSNTEKFIDIVSMIIYNNSKNEDISRLYSTVDLETFLKIISLFECRTIEFPSKKEIREAIELALIYYYKNVLGINDYKELRKLNLINEESFSSISIGKRISKLNKDIVSKLENMSELFDFDEKD